MKSMVQLSTHQSDSPVITGFVISILFLGTASLLLVAYNLWGKSLIGDAYPEVERVILLFLSTAAYGAIATALLLLSYRRKAKLASNQALLAADGKNEPLQISHALIDSYNVAGLIFLGLLLRLPSLNMGLWRDEASTYFDALPGSIEMLVKRVIYSELNPPGFYLIMHQWMDWFGISEILFKIPALIFGLLLIPTCYALGRVAASRSVGLIAAGLITFAPQAVYLSQEARPYTLAALLVCVVTLVYLKTLHSNHQRWYLLVFVLSATLLLYVQYTGLLLLGSLVLVTAVLFWWRIACTRPIPYLISFGAIFALYLPWLPIFLMHLNTGTPWIEKEPWVTRPMVFFKIIGYTAPWPGGKSIAKGVFVLLVLFALALSLRSLFSRAREQPYLQLSSQMYGTIVGAAFLLSAIILTSLSYREQYVFPFLPLIFVLYGIWLSHVGRYLHKRGYLHPLPGLLILLYLLAIPNCWWSAALGEIPKSGIRTLSADITETQYTNTIYLVSPDYLGPTFGYYFTKHKVEFHGFARWDDPHIFSPIGYADIWSRQGANITETEKLIRSKAYKGYRHLALIQDGCGKPLSDAGKMQYSFSNKLLSRLESAYPLQSKKTYPGTSECVVVYLFDLASPLGHERDTDF